MSKAFRYNLYRYVSIALIILFSSSLLFPNTSTITFIDRADQLQLIGKQTYFLEDKEGDLTIEKILSTEYQHKFHKQAKDVFSRPATESAFWFKVSISNKCNEDGWLEVGSTYAWFIDFYTPDSLGNYNEPIQTGTMRANDSKPYDVNLFWLPVNKANEQNVKVYYLRIKSGLTYELPIHIGTIRSLSKNKDVNDYFTAGFIGLILIMFLYNAFIYFSTRDHIYIYYLGYLFLMLISMPYANGYPFIQKIDFMFLNKEWWNNYFLFWHPFVYFFIGEFCIQYLDLEKNARILKRLIHFEMLILAGLIPLLTIIGVPFVKLVNITQALILIFYLTCLITGYYLVLKRVKSATYYILGWTFMVTGAFIFFAVINGFLPFNPISRNTLYFGVAIEVWMFSLALGNRLNILQKEKELIQIENISLITKQNEILEVKVKNRTEELVAMNEELSQSNEELFVTTEKLNLQSQELQKLNATKDKLFAIISHDLKSPLITLKNLLQLAGMDSIDIDTYKKESSRIKKDVESIQFTLQNLLQWALIQMQGLSTKKETFSIKKVTSEDIQLLREFIAHKNIKLTQNIDAELMLKADPNLVRLVFRNILNNAIKFTPKNGSITIESKISNGFCQLSVEDSGIGIPGEKLNKLFKNVSVESKFGTEGEKGTGLGLMLCQEFSKQNGGEIWVESDLGKGSKFYFTIPL